MPEASSLLEDTDSLLKCGTRCTSVKAVIVNLLVQLQEWCMPIAAHPNLRYLLEDSLIEFLKAVGWVIIFHLTIWILLIILWQFVKTNPP